MTSANCQYAVAMWRLVFRKSSPYGCQDTAVFGPVHQNVALGAGAKSVVCDCRVVICSLHKMFHR